jgi:hypothetical protein
VHSHIATTPSGLYDLTGLVHDAQFELDDLRYEVKDGVVEIPLTEPIEEAARFGWHVLKSGVAPGAMLCIHAVKGLKINDEARVGDYLIDQIWCEEVDGQQTIVLEATIPLRIEFAVEAINVELRQLRHVEVSL